ncbi:MAG: nuclear transport factor 2 family protein [Pseudomonadota bacterium]
MWMIKLTLNAIALAACVALLPGCATPEPANEIATLARQAHAWDGAIVRKDLPAIAANMAPDYRHIRDNGAVSDGAAFLAFMGSPKLLIAPYQVDDLDVRLYGDVALLSGTTRMSGSYDGAPFKSHYRYTDVYVKRGGQWRVSSVQITAIAE